MPGERDKSEEEFSREISGVIEKVPVIKFEFRSTKFETNSKFKFSKPVLFRLFKFRLFDIVSDFDIWISDLTMSINMGEK